MATQKTKVPFTTPDGRTEMVDAIPVQVDEATERWNEYKLSDGTTVKMKQVLVEILRVEGRSDAQGQPMYVMKASPVMLVEARPELKAKTQ